MQKKEESQPSSWEWEVVPFLQGYKQPPAYNSPAQPSGPSSFFQGYKQLPAYPGECHVPEAPRSPRTSRYLPTTTSVPQQGCPHGGSVPFAPGSRFFALKKANEILLRVSSKRKIKYE
ncbi:hypothetical protein M8J75_011038 [Diaphorina citri]|nr:hypothetical protein M8J75_011038 [Diaphorina citri]KAI5726193.1 hypothetical protein M8J77_025093 [Diaphorina citri]